MADHVNIRLDEATAREVDARAGEVRGTGASSICRRDLDRYYTVLRDSRRQLAGVITREEWCLIMDACNGLLVMDAAAYQLTWAEVADAIHLARQKSERHGLADSTYEAKWGLTTEAADDLVRRLRAMSPGHAMAVVDAIEQFWARCAEDPDATLLDLGLIEPRP